MSLRAAMTRLPTSQLVAATEKRMLSSKGTAAVTKFRHILEEYRMQNYAQEVPSRFKKEVISAAKRREDGLIALEGIERVLHNIGASNKISHSEMEIIFNELGESGYIPTERMASLM